jgi:uncharacterized membrane protein HdeD (DUF308 family)
MSSTTKSTESARKGEPLSNTLQSKWKWLLVAGVAVSVLGFVAMVSPFLTGISVTVLVGWVLIGGAVLQFVGAFRGRGWKGFLWQVALGTLSLIAGVAVLLNPVFALATLTLLVIGYLLASGVVEIVMGFRLRGEAYWAWSVASGVIGVALAVLLWLGFPTTALWAVGVLFGVNLLSTGLSMVMLAFGARGLTTPSPTESASEVGGV